MARQVTSHYSISGEREMIAMYLVRTIQKMETRNHVDKLGRDLEFTLPLPIVPRRPFTKVIVIHGKRALEFDLHYVDPVDIPENIPVGTNAQPVIHARSYIYVRRGPKRTGRAKVRGFRGIRYVDHWSDVAD